MDGVDDRALLALSNSSSFVLSALPGPEASLVEDKMLSDILVLLVPMDLVELGGCELEYGWCL